MKRRRTNYPQHPSQVRYLLCCLVFGGKCCMSLLPQELSCPQEGLRVLELPSLKEEVGKKEYKEIEQKQNFLQQVQIPLIVECVKITCM